MLKNLAELQKADDQLKRVIEINNEYVIRKDNITFSWKPGKKMASNNTKTKNSTQT